MLQLPPRCRSLVRHLACALACAALAMPAGAVIIDTSDQTIDEGVAELESIVRDRLPDAGFG